MLSLLLLFAGSAKPRKAKQQSAPIYKPKYVSNNNFEKLISSNPWSILLVMADSDTSSTDLLPKFRAVGEIMQNKCQFVVLDCDFNNETCAEHNFTVIPSLHVYRDGKYSVEYTGLQNASHIMNYVKQFTGNPITLLTDDVQTNDFIRQYPVSVILSGEEISPEVLSAFEETAASMNEKVVFAWAKTPEAIEQANKDGEATIRIHRRVDNFFPVYEELDSISSIGLKEWVEENIVPRYRDLSDASALRSLLKESKLSLVAFPDTSRKAHMTQMHACFEQVLMSHGDHFTLLYGDSTAFQMIPAAIGLAPSANVQYMVLQFDNGEIVTKYVFPPQQEATPPMIKNFADQVWNILYPPPLKSEDIPENDPNSPVQKLVGNTFIEFVNDTSSNYMTLFLTGEPDSRSKAIHLLEVTAKEMTKHSEIPIKFGHIDLELNDVPGLKLPELKAPTFVIWPAGKSRKPQMLPESVTAKQMLQIIAAEARTSTQIKTPPKDEQGSLEL